MSIGRGSGLSGVNKSAAVSSLRSEWSFRNKNPLNRNALQSPVWPMQFGGTSVSYTTASFNPALSSSAVGAVNYPVSGAISFNLLLTSTTSTATLNFPTSGTSYLPAIIGTGSGDTVASGSGAFFASGSTFLPRIIVSTFNATETFTATASTRLPRISGSAAGTETFTATGADTLRLISGSAAGTETFTAAGNSPLPIIGTPGGTQVFTGTGNGTFQAISGSAAGTETFTATASTRLPRIGGSAAGTETFTASGSTNIQTRFVILQLAALSGTISSSLPRIQSDSYATLTFNSTLSSNFTLNVTSSAVATETFAASGSCLITNVITASGYLSSTIVPFVPREVERPRQLRISRGSSAHATAYAEHQKKISEEFEEHKKKVLAEKYQTISVSLELVEINDSQVISKKQQVSERILKNSDFLIEVTSHRLDESNKESGISVQITGYSVKQIKKQPDKQIFIEIKRASNK